MLHDGSWISFGATHSPEPLLVPILRFVFVQELPEGVAALIVVYRVEGTVVGKMFLVQGLAQGDISHLLRRKDFGPTAGL